MIYLQIKLCANYTILLHFYSTLSTRKLPTVARIASPMSSSKLRQMESPRDPPVRTAIGSGFNAYRLAIWWI